MQSKAATVSEYLKELPAERRAVIAAVRKAVRANLPKGYRETMNWGMISYEIPLSRYPETYNGQPLSYAGLAAQKNNYALYLMCTRMDPKLGTKLRDGFKKAGKKLGAGLSCLRFKKLEDLPLDTIGEVIAAMPVDTYLKRYEIERAKRKS
jgi:hypothetical protein